MDGATMKKPTALESVGSALRSVNWRMVGLVIAGLILAVLAVLIFTPVVKAIVADPVLLRSAAGFVAAVMILSIWGRKIWAALVAGAQGIWRGLVAAFRGIVGFCSGMTIVGVTFTALWIAITIACCTLYVWDASFYHSLAPPGMELTFMAAGVVFRTFVIFGGLAIIWIKQNTPKRDMEPASFFGIKYQRPIGTNFFAKSAQTLRGIWIMGLIACGVAAMGFVTEGNDFHYRRAGAVTQTETATTESADVTIKRATDEKAAIRADRDAQTASARKSMDLVLDDGNSNNDDVSQYEANIKKYTDDAQAKLDAQDAIIAAAEASRLTAKTTATQEAIGDPGLAAVFRTPGRYIANFDGLTFRDVFAIFWVVLLEACGSVGAQSLLAVQMALNRRRAKQEAGAKGGKTTARRSRVNGKLKAIEDLRAEKASAEEVEDDDPDDGGPDNDAEDDEPEQEKAA